MKTATPRQSTPADPAPLKRSPAADAVACSSLSMGGALPAWSDSPRQLKQAEQLSQLQPAPSASSSAPGGLPDGLRSGLESLSGLDLSGVRVHRNSSKPASLQAHAYAQGQDIHLGPGQDKHLPHEAWHVVQQAQGRVRPTVQMKAGVAVNDDAGLEREADVMGSKALTAIAPKEGRTAGSGQQAPQSALVVQRAELDAVNLANHHHPAGHYTTWASVSAARGNEPLITDNWRAIATAYKLPGPVFNSTAALDHEAGRMFADARSWTDPQARREARNVLDQMAAMRRQLKSQLASMGPGQHPLMHLTAISNQLETLEGRIGQIKTKFLMAHRAENSGSWTTDRWWGFNKQRTMLDLPQGGKLELFNKINPETNEEQGLGEGGLGYGRFGQLNGETKFVKKQKLRKNEASAEAGISTPLFEQPAEMQTQQLAWIEEEMVKFRRELDITTHRLNHENVIKTYGGAVETSKPGESPKAYMVMDMMHGGDLNQVSRDGATDQRKKEIMLGALAGLAHVHASGLIHRDIKPDNIMLDSNGNAKLIDFGEAVDMDANNEFRTRTKAGTAGYYHPTKIQNVAHGQDMIYDVSTDLYALYKTFEALIGDSEVFDDWLQTFLVDGQTATSLHQSLTGLEV